MSDIISVSSKIGFKDISSVLASGNIIFSTESSDLRKIANEINKAFEKEFGFNPRTTLRTSGEIKTLIEENPFKEVHLGKNEKAYISFLGYSAVNSLEFPVKSESFRILDLKNKNVISTVNLDNASSQDLMQFLDKTFGKDVTTRGFPAIEKIYKKLILTSIK